MTVSANQQAFDQPALTSRFDIPHPTPFIYKLKVEADDVAEPVGHATNDRIVRWLGDAAAEHSASVGFSYESLVGMEVMWFVARHEIEYLMEAFKGDELIIATWVRSIRRVKAWRESIVVRPSDESVIVRASTLWVLVDLQRRRPRSISASMAASFSPLQHRTA